MQFLREVGSEIQSTVLEWKKERNRGKKNRITVKCILFKHANQIKKKTEEKYATKIVLS